MAKTYSVSLGEYWSNFIEDQLEKGRYSSSSEVIRDALRLLEEKELEIRLEKSKIRKNNS